MVADPTSTNVVRYPHSVGHEAITAVIYFLTFDGGFSRDFRHYSN